MKRAYVTTGAAIVVVAGVQPGSAAATPAEGEIVRTEIAKGTTAAPVAIVAAGQVTAFYIQNLILKPGSSSGWHTHPGPEYSIVKRGTVYLQQAPGCEPVAYNEGDAVFIQTGTPHVVTNRGPADAEAIVTYTLPADHALRDDASAACP